MEAEIVPVADVTVFPSASTTTTCTLGVMATPFATPVGATRKASDAAVPGSMLKALLVAAPNDLLAMHPVGTSVNNVRNNGIELLDPVLVG